MKKLFAIACLTLILVSCEKDDKKTPCPKVSTDTLPAKVLETYNQKYNGATSTTWFDVNSKSYTAVFEFNGKHTKSNFTKDGDFVSEEIGDQNNNDNQEGDDSECDCGTEDQ